MGEIYRFGDLVALHPKIGRPAGLLAAGSVEGQLQPVEAWYSIMELGMVNNPSNFVWKMFLCLG